MVGATTLDEYRKHIEKDPALETAFPAGVRGGAGAHGRDGRHPARPEGKVRSPPRRTHHRSGPGGGGYDCRTGTSVTDFYRTRLSISWTKPGRVSASRSIRCRRRSTCWSERRIQFEIEREALKDETDARSVERLRDVESELAETREKLAGLKARWTLEKEAIERVRELKRQLEELGVAADQATRAGDLQRAAEINYGQLPATREELETAEAELQRMQAEGSFLTEEVGPEDVAEVVASWTGIPVTRMLESEMDRLAASGGPPARAGRRSGGSDPRGVQCRAAFARGSSGPQPAARELHLSGADGRRQDGDGARAGRVPVRRRECPGTHRHVRVHGASRGVPADRGPAGLCRLRGGRPAHRAGVRRRPYAVVLFDEIEKAHPEVFNVLLQILDDGRLTDGQGRTVNFTNTVLIMTSNVGSSWILEHSGDDWEIVEAKVREDLHGHFRPEFLNRIDEILVFRPLSRENLSHIAGMQLRRLQDFAADRDISLDISEQAKEKIADEGYDPAFGARPLKRAIQRLVSDPLALELLNGRFGDGDSIRIDVEPDTGDIVFEKLPESGSNDA